MSNRITTYMSINFQQNQFSTSVKPVRTNTFAKNCINLQLSDSDSDSDILFDITHGNL